MQTYEKLTRLNTCKQQRVKSTGTTKVWIAECENRSIDLSSSDNDNYKKHMILIRYSERNSRNVQNGEAP